MSAVVDGPCVLKILRDKKNLLNHAFAQDPFLVPVGVEQKHRVSIRVNHPASRVPSCFARTKPSALRAIIRSLLRGGFFGAD
jgi:hypothetical protein